MVLLGAAFVIFLWELGKTALKHSPNYQNSRAAAVKGAEKKAAPKQLGGGKRRVAVSRHAVGWWGREAVHGFPHTLTGLQNGWQAHRTALAQQRAKQQEIRTSGIEARASIEEELPQHRERQAAAQQRIDAARVVTICDPSGDELAAKRAAKTDPPLPADGVQQPQPAGGTPMATQTDGSYTTTITAAKAQAEQADYTAADIAAQAQAAAQILEEMEAANVDAASLSDQADLVARLQAAEQALRSVTEQGETVGAGVTQRHGGMKEAVDDAPVDPAELGWYKD